MPITLKIAETAKEIDDALWVRHEVFVVEDGRFGGKPLHGERLIDRYDALPETWNVVAYDGAEPVATIRLFKENELGLPVDDLFDFSANAWPRYKVRAAFEFFRRLYIVGGVDDVLNDRPLDGTGGGRDYFVGGQLRFNDEDLKSLLMVGGSSLGAAGGK